ncbi:hypothetical protein OT109_01420 [Phycisphaeraceae bacterium D3-23]
MNPSTLTVPDSGCKLVDRQALIRLLGGGEDLADKFIGAHLDHFTDLNKGASRRRLVISRAKLDRILLGDLDPLEQALADPKPKAKVRKPRRQHI